MLVAKGTGLFVVTVHAIVILSLVHRTGLDILEMFFTNQI